MSSKGCWIVYHGIAFFEVHVEGGPVIFIDPCVSLNPSATARLEELPRPDAVLVTHGAKDHVGDAIEIVRDRGSLLIAPRNVLAHAGKKGIPPDSMKYMVAGVSRDVGTVAVKALETRHHSFYNSEGQILSDVSLSYLLRLPDGLKLYHLGDSALSADMKMFGEVYRPDVVLVPIGKFAGAEPELPPEEAALATAWLGARIAIPMHYDLQEEADAPETYAREIRRLGLDVEVLAMQPGEGRQLHL